MECIEALLGVGEMTIWLTTDTHFNHRKLEEWGRPSRFEDIISRGFRQVKAEDLLLHLGDVCIGLDEEMHRKYITPLKCRKWLVKGNHDRKSNSWYLGHGWDCVCQTLRDRYSGKDILFSHIPVADDGYDLNIHGHFHSSDHRRHDPKMLAIKNDKQKLIALEQTGYMPVTLESILKEEVGR